jgi:hypothetical protein
VPPIAVSIRQSFAHGYILADGAAIVSVHLPRAKNNFMADVISDYQKWKQQGENLKTQARQAMESRFRELLTEAMSIAEEYRADFGAPLKPPPAVTAFRYKTSAKPKPRKSKQSAAQAAVIAPPASKDQKPDPKLAGLQKRLATAKKKLEDAKAAGSPTRKIEDHIYEIEDALRLAGQPARTTGN